MDTSVPPSLRTWFLGHFLVDLLFGIPLLAIPATALTLFGFPATNLVLARLIGAALLGIGGASLSMHGSGKETYRALLDLKILWSLSAIAAFGVSLLEGAPQGLWGFLLLFVLFSTTWIYYRFFTVFQR